MAADPTRRAVITATAALPLVLTGCKGLSALSGPSRPAAGVTLLKHAIGAEAQLADRYQAALGALRASPALLAVLRPVLAEHQAHLVQLRAQLAPGRALVPQPAGRRRAAAPLATGLPAGSRQILGYLEAAERHAAARLTAQLLAAPPSLAQLLASISASEATHVPVLAAARRSA